MGYNKKWYTERRKARIVAGVCTECGKRLPIEGILLCDPCDERKKEATAALRLRRWLDLTCKRHGNKVREGMNGCDKCRAYWAARAKLRRKRKHERSVDGNVSEAPGKG